MLRKFVNGNMRLSRGATLMELIIATAVFGFLTLALLGILQFGTRSWRHVESRFQVEKDIRRAVLDINSYLRNTDIATFNSGNSVGDASSSTAATEISWMSFKTATSYESAGDILEGQLDYSPEDASTGIKWTFHVLYYMIPLENCKACADIGISDEKLCPHKQLVKKWLWINTSTPATPSASAPVLANGSAIDPGLPYLTSAQVTPFLSAPLPDARPFPRILANNVMNFNVAFYDPTAAYGSWRAPQALAAKPGTVQYTIRCFKQLEATQVRLTNEHFAGTSESQKRFVEKFTMQIDQGVAPLNNTVNNP